MKFLAYFTSILALLAGAGVVGTGAVLVYYSGDLPDHTALKAYAPPITTRLHASDGSIIGEYARERRLFLPIEAIPGRVLQAFISAEDQNFFSHPGFDAAGIARAAITNIRKITQGDRPHGASTITQQIAKNFLLTSEVSYERKIKEILLATRIEQALTKEEILELYLNDIFLGLGTYGVGSASLTYFDKPIHALALHEIAYLASLPKGPANYHPVRRAKAAIERRNWVLGRMAAEGYVTGEEAGRAQEMPLGYKPVKSNRPTVESGYFTEEVRRELVRIYGEEKLYEGGLSVRTTLDPKLQAIAHRALAEGLLKYDRSNGWRGPVEKGVQTAQWTKTIEAHTSLNDLFPWRLAIVLEVESKLARVGIKSSTLGSDRDAEIGRKGIISLSALKWAVASDGPRKGKKVRSVGDVLSAGDIIYVRPGKKDGAWELIQLPAVQGALVAMDPVTGRVRAMIGGLSYAQSQFNRATQALRQPGSSFKPFVYAAAIENGYTPSTVILDAPIEVAQGEGKDAWRPENYSKRYYGPSTLRLGIERSRNLMTVRLARDIGMTNVVYFAREFGAYNALTPVLAMSLGAGETTVKRMTAAYSVFANGGFRVVPRLIDRVQDRFGRTILRPQAFRCVNCSQSSWKFPQEPVLKDLRHEVISPQTAYQLTSMLEGVIKSGTGKKAQAASWPLAGKTGTSNDEKDAWFVGFSHGLVVGVFVGFDFPKSMGKKGTGGSVAAPIFRDFMSEALDGQPPVPFKIPTGIEFTRVSKRKGTLALGASGMTEVLKSGEEPGDNFWIYGGEADSRLERSRPSATPEEGLDVGTGGLY